MKKILLTIATILFTNWNGMSATQEISVKPLNCFLEWDAQRGDNWIKVTYINSDSRPAKLPERWLFKGGELSWEAFEVKCDAVPVKYSGATVKRTANEKSIVIGPGEKISVHVDLSTGYRLTKDCAIKLRGFYSAPVDPPGLLEIQSDVITR